MKNNKIKYKKAINDLAWLLVTRNNKNWMGAITGEVVKAPPNLEVKIDPKITLKTKNIVISEEKISTYTREFKSWGNVDEIVINGEIETTSSNTEGGPGPHNHQHGTISGTLKGKGTFKLSGTNEWTDDLKVGDMVLLVPTNEHEIFYLVDKVVRADATK